jgi:hypothetical protein
MLFRFALPSFACLCSFTALHVHLIAGLIVANETCLLVELFTKVSITSSTNASSFSFNCCISASINTLGSGNERWLLHRLVCHASVVAIFCSSLTKSVLTPFFIQRFVAAFNTSIAFSDRLLYV